MHAYPFNMMIVQTYTSTSDYSDDLVEEYYTQFQETVDRVNRKDFWIVQGDMNAKTSLDTMRTGEKYMAHHVIVPSVIEGYIS